MSASFRAMRKSSAFNAKAECVLYKKYLADTDTDTAGDCIMKPVFTRFVGHLSKRSSADKENYDKCQLN